MSDKLHHTKGIVLRSVKYGETSLIVTLFTSLFGLQSYIINGVRTASQKGSNKANLFQPPAILDMVVYHNELKQLNRIREYKWAVLYQQLFSDVKKNAVALYMTELLTRCLRQPETNEDLFHFAEDAFLHLDEASSSIAANFPLFFALQLPAFFGFGIHDNYSDKRPFLDLQEGEFTAERPAHPHFLDEKQSSVTSDFLKTRIPAELEHIRLNQEFRRNLLLAYEKYYAFHVHEFGSLKTLPVLREILS